MSKIEPDGWVLVPREPTKAMMAAWTRPSRGAGHQAIYRAMLAAAPKPETEGVET